MSDFEGPDGRKVVERFLAGDPGVYAEARRAAENVVSRRVHGIPPAEREDIVQETLLATYEAFSEDGFRLRKGLGPFVGRLAKCRCLDWRRRQKMTVEVPPDIADPKRGPDGDFEANERDHEATKVLKALSAAHRRLIDLHFRRRLPYAVIAAMTGRSEGALRVEMCEGLRKARRILDEIRRRGPAPPEPRGSGR